MNPSEKPPEDSPAHASTPVMDVVPPAPQDTTVQSPAAAFHAQVKAPKAPAPPKEKSSSVTLAILATVIIILGLAALATYAYLQTNK